MSTSPLLTTPSSPSAPSQPRPDRSDSQTLTLPDGRTLGYARYGSSNPAHAACIYLHGYPSSRLEAAQYSATLLSQNLQLLSLDRPGFGLSSPSPAPISSRLITDHISDIVALADHLSLSKFYILGISGGAPYAFACAARIPHRLLGIGILAGFGPWSMARQAEVWRSLHWLNKLGLVLPVRIPWLYQRLYGLLVPIFLKKMTAASYSDVVNDKAFKKVVQSSPDAKLLLDRGEAFYDDAVAATREAFRQGDFAKAHVDEARLLAKEWPFELGDIKVQTDAGDASGVMLRMWYGSQDENTPPELGRLIADAIGQGVRCEVVDGGTHSTVVADGVRYLRLLIGLDAEDERVSQDQEQG